MSLYNPFINLQFLTSRKQSIQLLYNLCYAIISKIKFNSEVLIMNNIIKNKNIALLLAGAAIISFSPVFTRLTTVSSGISAFYRVFFGALFLLVFCLIKKEKLWVGVPAFLYSILAGFFFSLDLFVWHKSIHYIGPGLATVLGNFQVVFITFISFLVFKEKINWKFYLSIFLALTGILLLCGVNWNGNTPDYKTGVILGLLTAVFYTGYILTLNFAYKLKNKLSPSCNVFWACVSSAIILGIISKSSGESFDLITSKNMIILLLYGVFCQGVGWVFISSSMSNIPVSTSGLILLLQPILSMTWDILFFKRPTSIMDLAGFVLSLGAIYLGSVSKESENKNLIKTEEV